MAIPLYDLSVAGFLRTLTNVSGILDRGLAHLVDNGVDPNTVVEARLAPDMLPLSFQVVSVAHHSLGAIEAIERGVFSPPTSLEAPTYADLQKVITDARVGLQKRTSDEINGLQGRDLMFQAGRFQAPFVAEVFLMSFSIPNFHFHATTTYDILRAQGAPLGKRDYLGPLQTKT